MNLVFKRKLLIKRIHVLILSTLLTAFQCEEEPIYENMYKIKNESSYNLTLITECEEVILEKPTTYISEYSIAEVSEVYSLVKPSDNKTFDEISIYREDGNGGLILTYEQFPILDDL
jgi:hypothetical protein